MRHFAVIVAISILFGFIGEYLEAKPTTLKREEIPAEYKWNFSDMYADWNAWEKDVIEMEKLMKEYIALKGTLGKSAQTLLYSYQLGEKLGVIAVKVFRYVGLQREVDAREQSLLARMQRIGFMYNQFASQMAWYNNEFLAIPQETVKKWIAENKELQRYALEIDGMYRSRKYVLPEDIEQALSYYSAVMGAPSSIHSQLVTADMKYPEITLSTGEKVTITEGTFGQIMKDEKLTQEDRKNTYYAFMTMYKGKINTLAAIYNAICQNNAASVRARKYDSILQMQLYGNDIPVSVYENLVTAAKSNTKQIQRYMEMKKDFIKKRKNLETYMPYDGSLSLTDFTKDYTFEDSKKNVITAAAFFGKDYQNKVKKAFESGWIDVYENEGKSTGAFNADVYGVHPFIMLNYNDTQENMFTVCHEMGHAMHSVYSNENQSYQTHSPSIFVAEVASTMNERIMLDHLLATTTDPNVRIALLRQAIGNITGTFYYQTLLADFELQVNKRAEQGEPITAEVLNSIMAELDLTYYGTVVPEIKEFTGISWTMIDHIYSQPFYVYQYATSFAASSKLYKDMTTGSKTSREAAKARYLELLKSGSNDYPMNILKKAGVDMNKPEVVQAVIDDLKTLVDLMEKELKKLK